MGFDAVFKRYFAAVVCLLIGVAAYFQASGMGQLVGATVALDPSATPVAPPLPRVGGAVAAANPDHGTLADPIIGRNPFDSVTGPLDAKSIDPPSSAPPVTDANRDPYDDPYCDVAKTVAIIASNDPDWSFASLAGTDGKTSLRVAMCAGPFGLGFRGGCHCRS